MAAHPYYPLALQLPNYVPMGVDHVYVLGIFSVATAIVIAVTWFVSGSKTGLSTTERVISCWFAVTAIIHLIVEGYVVIRAEFYTDPTGIPSTFLSDVWREYSKADSRYASRDSFIIGMEAVTAFVWGPVSFALVHGLLNKKIWRYTLMIIVSLGQIYGDVLYFATCFMEGLIHTRPEPMYFWIYFLAVNGIWIVVPSLCIRHAFGKLHQALAVADKRKRN